MTLIPTQVTFRGVPHSDALEAAIKDRVSWLEQHCDEIAGCHVMVDVPHRHKHEPRPFNVRVELTVPRSAPIVATREESPDPYVAVHEAFDVARRRLENAFR